MPQPQAYELVEGNGLPSPEQYDEKTYGHAVDEVLSEGSASASRGEDSNNYNLPIFNTPQEEKNSSLTHLLFSSDLSTLFTSERLSLIANHVLWTLAPSFVYNRKFNKSAAPTKITSTTYLGGLRGTAAFFVFCQHYIMEYYQWIFYGYGARPEDNHWIQLPIFKIFHAGAFMVSIFFILSGYVLSYKVVGLTYKHNGSAAHDVAIFDTLISSTFRRMPRLFYPMIVPWIFATFLVYWGFYTELDFKPEIVPTASAASAMAQLSGEWEQFKALFDPFTWIRFDPNVMVQLWTIPVEFRGSIIVFLTLLGLAKVKHWLRIPMEFIFACFCMAYGRWDLFLFLHGIILAEMRVIRNVYPGSAYGLATLLKNQPRALEITRLVGKVALVAGLFFGLYLGCWPNWKAEVTPGYTWFYYNTPKVLAEQYKVYERFWLALAGVTLMVGLEHLEFLQKPFNHPAVQYMGDVSYAFYIVHWPFLRTFGRYFTVGVINFTGSHNIGFIIAFIVNTIVLILISDIHMRLGDQVAMKVSRWLQKVCFM